jgi:hypothetical protein
MRIEFLYILWLLGSAYSSGAWAIGNVAVLRLIHLRCGQNEPLEVESGI